MKKRIDILITITKDERKIISEHFPDVCIVRTMKQKSKRHHYYCEEAPRVLRLLDQIRGAKNISVSQKTNSQNVSQYNNVCS